MPRGKYNRNRNKEAAPAPVNPSWLTPQPTGLTKFDVTVEDSHGTLVAGFEVIAQSKGEAINRAKQQLVFTAERSK